MQKETFYFSHDYNSRTDKKIKRLLVAYGMLGYGLWWALIEDLYNNNNDLPLHYDSIAYELHCDIEVIKAVINDFGLFDVTETSFSSASVQRRLNERIEKSLKAKENIAKRWGNKKDKQKEKKQFIPPSQRDVIDYFKENGFSKDAAIKAHAYYDANEWKDSRGKSVQNWKQKMHGNWFTTENKTSSSPSNGVVI